MSFRRCLAVTMMALTLLAPAACDNDQPEEATRLLTVAQLQNIEAQRAQNVGVDALLNAGYKPLRFTQVGKVYRLVFTDCGTKLAQECLSQVLPTDNRPYVSWEVIGEPSDTITLGMAYHLVYPALNDSNALYCLPHRQHAAFKASVVEQFGTIGLAVKVERSLLDDQTAADTVEAAGTTWTCIRSARK